jgi:hypothetical protein
VYFSAELAMKTMYLQWSKSLFEITIFIKDGWIFSVISFFSIGLEIGFLIICDFKMFFDPLCMYVECGL